MGSRRRWIIVNARTASDSKSACSSSIIPNFSHGTIRLYSREFIHISWEEFTRIAVTRTSLRHETKLFELFARTQYYRTNEILFLTIQIIHSQKFPTRGYHNWSSMLSTTTKIPYFFRVGFDESLLSRIPNDCAENNSEQCEKPAAVVIHEKSEKLIKRKTQNPRNNMW